jgi:ABC-type multidrug transport system ATPase subunit
MIATHKLSKRLGQRQVFRHLEFTWQAPAMICVCGPNGSGKTTLLAMLGGALPPDSGDVRVNDISLVSAHAQAIAMTTYAPDACPAYPFLSGVEWLDFIASIRSTDHKLRRELIESFGLLQHTRTSFAAMSLGTARKFMLTAALICRTPLLILDEPTNGLDQRSFEVLALQLQRRAEEGLVVLTCHDPALQSQLGVQRVELSSLEAA